MKRRIKDFFSRDRKTLYMILSIVLISIFSLTIVYAALSVTLNIQGNAQVVASTWDIHLDNAKVTSGSVSDSIPTISSDGKTVTFSTTLNMPGDFYEFTIDAVNDGSIDAMIDSVTKTPTLTTEQAKYLNYIIEYQNGESISTKQLVSKNSYVRLKVRVEFRKDITASDLPTTSETLNLAFTVNYVQSDGSGSSVTDNGVYISPVQVISGDGTKVGDEICIQEECFYVISSTDDTVTMLAKTEITTPYLDTPIQSTTISRPIPFSYSTYWLDNGILKSEYSLNNSYIYDNNSVMYSFIESYKTYLESIGALIIEEARLISLNELYSLGCSYSNCDNAPEWVFLRTPYWTGNYAHDDYIYAVNNSIIERYYNLDALMRPVIVFSRDWL